MGKKEEEVEEEEEKEEKEEEEEEEEPTTTDPVVTHKLCGTSLFLRPASQPLLMAPPTT